MEYTHQIIFILQSIVLVSYGPIFMYETIDIFFKNKKTNYIKAIFSITTAMLVFLIPLLLSLIHFIFQAAYLFVKLPFRKWWELDFEYSKYYINQSAGYFAITFIIYIIVLRVYLFNKKK